MVRETRKSKNADDGKSKGDAEEQPVPLSKEEMRLSPNQTAFAVAMTADRLEALVEHLEQSRPVLGMAEEEEIVKWWEENKINIVSEEYIEEQ